MNKIHFQSDSNLSHYHGTTSGETSPMENPSFNGNHNNSFASPFKGDFNNKGGLDRHSGLLPEYEPYHTRSSFNLNNYGNTSPAPVQKVDKATMYSSDLLVRINCQSVIFKCVNIFSPFPPPEPARTELFKQFRFLREYQRTGAHDATVATTATTTAAINS